MEYNIEDLAKETSNIVDVDQAAHKAVGPCDIRVDRDCIQEISGNNEIRLAIAKRFDGKRTLHGDPGFRDLVAWCLGTDSYKVCERNLERVHDKDIDLVWQFIDTISVSSTAQCRAIVAKYTNGRSSVGFRREHMRPLVVAPRKKVEDRRVAPSAIARYSEADSGGYESLRDLVLEDCMHWVLKSRDPLTSALQLRSRILEGSKGAQYPSRHT
jgi:hypothetical protein